MNVVLRRSYALTGNAAEPKAGAGRANLPARIVGHMRLYWVLLGKLLPGSARRLSPGSFGWQSIASILRTVVAS